MLPSDLLTPKQAAKLVAVHVSTIYRWVLSGKLKAYRRAGSRYVVSRSDVEALVQPVEVVSLTKATEAKGDRTYEEALERLRRAGLAV